MRKLASIQKVEKLSPIEGADRIECADILGWHCVVKKGEFKEGDLCVYFEVDSIVPDKPCFEFLKDHKFRIKTHKFKKQISQGLAFPIFLIEQSFGVKIPKELGEDVTALLEVVKFEPYSEMGLGGMNAKGKFPDFLIKTDETRIQSVPFALERFRNESFYVTEKLDGTSCTIYRREGEFGVCSRNLELNDGESPYWVLAKKYKIKETLEAEQIDNIALQGEVFGKGIQKNSLKQDDFDIRFFSVFDIKGYKFLDFAEAKQLIERLGLKFVPVIEENLVLNHTVDELVKFATRKTVIPLPYATNSPPLAEGCVFRPHHEKVDLEFAKAMGNGRVSFKVVNPEYLLEEE